MSGYPADPPGFDDIEHSGPDDPAQAEQDRDRRTPAGGSVATTEDEQAAAQSAVMGPD